MKKFLALVLCIAMVLTMAACSSTATPSETTPAADAPSAADSQEPAADSGEPMVYKALYGSEVSTLNYLIASQQWDQTVAANVIDSLVEDDVVVVDMFDKIFQGTYVGGNLSTAIKTRTKRGGAVIWGGIRDMEQIVKIDGINVYYRGIDPTGIGDVTMTGFNVPCRIGKATCLPGDVVLGTISGVIFIPSHLAEEVVIGAEKSHVRDIFGFQRLHDKVYTTAQIDDRWTYPMWQDFVNWFNTDPKAEEYRHLTWEEELAEAEKYEKDANASDVRL